MADIFIYDSYYGKIIFDTRSGKYYISGHEVFNIHDIVNENNEYTYKMTNLLKLFNLPFLNRKNHLYPINFTMNDVKLYIVRLNEKESRIIITICILVKLYSKDSSNRERLEETNLIKTIINIISKNYPNMYKEVLIEVKLGGKRY